MTHRFYFRWNGRITRDCGTISIEAHNEAQARLKFEREYPTRQIVSCMCSVPVTEVKTE